MATKTWGAGSTAGADGLWDTATNWDNDTLPVDGDDVVGDSGLYPNYLTTSPTTLVTLNSLDMSNFPVLMTSTYLENVNISNGYFYCFVPIKLAFTNLSNNPSAGCSAAPAICLTADSDIGVAQTLKLDRTMGSGSGTWSNQLVSDNGTERLLLRRDSTFEANDYCRTEINYHSSVNQQTVVKNDASSTFAGAAGLTRQSQSFTTDSSNYIFNRIVVPMETYKFSIYLADGSGHPTGSPIYQYTFNMKEIFKKTWKEMWIDGSEITLLPSTQYCAVFDMINHPQYTGVLDWFNTTNYCESGTGEVWSYWTGSAWSNLTTTNKKTFALHRLDDTFIKGNWFFFREATCSCFIENQLYGFPGSVWIDYQYGEQDPFLEGSTPYNSGCVITANKYYKIDSAMPSEQNGFIGMTGNSFFDMPTLINTPRFYGTLLIWFFRREAGSWYSQVRAKHVGGAYFDGIGQSCHLQPAFDLDNTTLSPLASETNLLMRIDNDLSLSNQDIKNDAQLCVYDTTQYGGGFVSKTIYDTSASNWFRNFGGGSVWNGYSTVYYSFLNPAFKTGVTQNNQIVGSTIVDVRCWDGLLVKFRLLEQMNIGNIFSDALTWATPKTDITVQSSNTGSVVDAKIVDKKAGFGAS